MTYRDDELSAVASTIDILGDPTDVVLVRVTDVLGRDRELQLDIETAVDLADVLREAADA